MGDTCVDARLARAAAVAPADDADLDDGSCDYVVVVPGCTDPTAANFVSSANRDDNSCKYALTTPSECKDPNAINYAPDAFGETGKAARAVRVGAARVAEHARAEAERAGAAWAVAAREAWERYAPTTVSYTHLTLPTT